MKNNELQIVINCPVEKVFEFTTNPKNTFSWLGVHESRDSEDVGLGTKYSNDTGLYFVTGWEENKMFELTAVENDYTVMYSYESFNPRKTKLTYKEWMHDGTDLPKPFTGEELDKLKEVMEFEVDPHIQSAECAG